MPAKSLEFLVQALLEQLPEESSPVVIVVKPDRPNPAPGRTDGHRTTSQGLLYDPSVVYILELATIIAMRDEETIELIGQAVADALHNVVRDASNVHPLVISRVVFYLLHLLNCSQVNTNFS
jgi:golgi-specific brefeldin A-resistance guanine nucleotide exchange factor 1